MKLCKKATDLAKLANMLNGVSAQLEHARKEGEEYLDHIKACETSIDTIQHGLIKGINDLLDEINNNNE